MNLAGNFTALVTPFKNNELDLDGLKENIRFQLKRDIDGIVVLGTTGEAPTLSPLEKRQIITAAVKEAGGKTSVIIGTSSNDTRTVVQNTLQAKEMGADGAMISSPYYNRPSQEGIYRHFEAIDQECRFPMLIYNVPKRTGCNIEPDTLFRIAALPNAFGVKEASGDIFQIQEILLGRYSLQKPFAVLCGDDLLAYVATALGGDGVVSVAGNLIPETMKIISSPCDLVKGRDHFYQWLPFLKALGLETNPVTIKTAMSLCEKAAGPCRLPLTPMDTNQVLLLTQVLAQYRLLKSAAGNAKGEKAFIASP